MESELKTESKTVFGARSIFKLFKSLSQTAVSRDLEYHRPV